MTTRVAVRLPDELVEQLDRAASANDRSRSEVVRRALELYVHRLDCERDATRYAQLPLSDAELALADDPDGWSVTPAY